MKSWRQIWRQRPISSRKTPALLNRLLRIGGDKDKGDQPLFAIASSSLALGAVGVLTTVAHWDMPDLALDAP